MTTVSRSAGLVAVSFTALGLGLVVSEGVADAALYAVALGLLVASCDARRQARDQLFCRRRGDRRSL